jgi:acetate kinase
MNSILTLNGGSSSLRFALFCGAEKLERVLAGKFERIGLADSKLAFTDKIQKQERRIDAPDHKACITMLAELLDKNRSGPPVTAIGHRVVHGGMRYSDPQRVDVAMLDELRRISPFDPEHLPAEIAIVEAFQAKYPQVPQIACFDTAFHRDLPRVAKLLPIPRRYEAKGVQRYGFHGLSYAYLMEELEFTAGATAAQGRIILAHLGNGASMAAVRDGQCIDTTMAFTPTAGLVMSTRSGDLDPGLVAFLASTEGMTAEQFHAMVNSKSGLLGISETSSDIRDLLQRESADPRAAEAVALFCYQAKKWIGALAAALGGLDTLVFSAGIGENSTVIRARICEGLGFLGIELDPARNAASASVITTDSSKAIVRVIRTDEEFYIATSVVKLLAT